MLIPVLEFERFTAEFNNLLISDSENPLHSNI